MSHSDSCEKVKKRNGGPFVTEIDRNPMSSCPVTTGLVMESFISVLIQERSVQGQCCFELGLNLSPPLNSDTSKGSKP